MLMDVIDVHYTALMECKCIIYHWGKLNPRVFFIVYSGLKGFFVEVKQNDELPFYSVPYLCTMQCNPTPGAKIDI